MARGQAAKLRRRANRKKGDEDDDGKDIFDEDTNDGDELPLPPSMQQRAKEKVVVETVTSDDDEDDDDNLPKKKNRSHRNAPVVRPASKSGFSLGNIKTGPLILLVIMTGTTLIPLLIYASDYMGKFLGQTSVLGTIGFRLGIGAVPRKRMTSFYEKHAPEKLSDVPSILSKHYGDYNVMIKKLERKYQDYGYFLGWEKDEATVTMALQQARAMYDTWITSYWNRYAPQLLKTYFRNIRYNLTFLYKKLRRLWKKHLWPLLEPIFGVPAGAEKQKRADQQAFREQQQRKRGTGGARRKNTDYRDEHEEEED